MTIDRMTLRTLIEKGSDDDLLREMIGHEEERLHLALTDRNQPLAEVLLQLPTRRGEITRNRIRRGVFKSVAELKAAIADYLEKHNVDPKPFVRSEPEGEIERNKR